MGYEEIFPPYDMCKEAEEIWQSYDLALVDLSITSGIGGIEASRRLVQMNPQIVLICTSGYVSDPIIADPKAHGFAAALAKPYSAELLSMRPHAVSGELSSSYGPPGKG